jgi:UDP:flavonoid glycosyltransferase YjiC (YdhE family)
VKYSKPTVCVPTQPEQLANGLKLQEMGCSIVARSKEQLKRALRRVEEELSSFRNNVEKLNGISNRYNGLGRAVEIIEETAA